MIQPIHGITVRHKTVNDVHVSSAVLGEAVDDKKNGLYFLFL